MITRKDVCLLSNSSNERCCSARKKSSLLAHLHRHERRLTDEHHKASISATPIAHDQTRNGWASFLQDQTRAYVLIYKRSSTLSKWMSNLDEGAMCSRRKCNWSGCPTGVPAIPVLDERDSGGSRARDESEIVGWLSSANHSLLSFECCARMLGLCR